ncbi:MAG TPA: ATP-binding protein [Lacipirellulaceae bacterium]|jgi:two-component system phosphate regulon sensor histidine kinase PhoR|nr:ATP-binding protein [Lacipirellulaceae bacterium]
MFAKNFQIRLPRRIAAYFLLFGVAALVWLAIGAVYVASLVTDGRSESASLRSLGRGSDRITLAYLKNKSVDLQPLMAEIRGQTGADYCAVVSPTGEYAAHSNLEQKGKGAEEVGSVTERWGEVQRVEYMNNHGLTIHEYRCPLKAGDQSFGVLRLGIARRDLWSYLRASAQFAPLALFGPACCMVAGAVLLNRMVRPVADIEQQLHQVATSPSLESCQWREVPNVGAAAIGWNRVVHEKLSADRGALQHKIQQSLEQGKQGRLAAVLNSVPDGIATTDSAGRLTYNNKPMAVILELNDLPQGEAADPDAAASTMTEHLQKSWQLPESDPLLADENRDRPVVTEVTRDEHGQRRIARIARYPVAGATGNQDAHVWTIRDVTQQKLAEEMRDQFVDTATHELRTPLANIKAYAETLALADMIDIEQQKQFLNTINSEATRLARFVDDLLSVSSMELGSLSLNKQVTDLTRMLNEVLVKVKPQMEEKQLTFEVAFPEKMPEPDLDKDKISAVLVNLLGNAVKYTPANGRVLFRVHTTDKQIEISVQDTGVGIAPDEVSKVFEKFFRSPDPRVQEQTGTGLGLALANEVVRLHGGKIEVESEINKGSTFTVLLPLV